MRKILCAVLAFIICSFSILSYAVEETNLQTEQENLKQQIESSNNNLTDVQSELSSNLQEVQKLDERIQSSENEVSDLNTKITDLQNSIDKVEVELKEAEKNYNTQEEVLEKRLVAMYESGDTQYLDVILTSKNISEFLSNYFLVTEMATYDTELLENMAERKQSIDIAKQKLEEEKKQINEVKQQQLKSATILQNVKILRENYMSKLSDKEKEIQKQIDEYTSRFNEINSQILELSKNGINTQYIGGELAWPVPGYTRITSEYGMRTHPITGVYKLHTGVDIGAPLGADFVAANNGVVTKAEYNSAYGNMVIIDHGGGISTLYAHGSEILVTVGQTVTRNQPILKVGSTGYSTGAHAHFEVRINGETTNPVQYITNGLIPESTTNSQDGSNTSSN